MFLKYWYTNGKSIGQLAYEHLRTEGAIHNRLEKLGCLEEVDTEQKLMRNEEALLRAESR